MKIIHCADLHLDSKMTANLDKDKARERKLELLDTYVKMVDYAADNGVSAILICGDMFDTKSVSALSRNTVLSSIQNHPDIMFFYLRGNHDSDSFINMLEEQPDNLYLFSSDSFTCYSLDDQNLINLYGVELTEENSGNIQLNFAPDPSKINIVMLHGQEAETSSKDKAEIINLKAFRNKGINYLALGHIHEYKCADLDGLGKYCYPGCLEGRGFDECGDHGFVLLDINEETGIINDRFIPMAKRRLYEVRVDISGLNETGDMLTRTKEALSQSGAQSKDLVKIVLVGFVGPDTEKDTDYILRNFKSDYYFVKLYDETKVKVNYEDYALDESLKGEFIRLCRELDLPDDEKGEIIKLGLNTLMGGKPEL